MIAGAARFLSGLDPMGRGGAEGVGFEPTRARALPVFKCGGRRDGWCCPVSSGVVLCGFAEDVVLSCVVLCCPVLQGSFANRFATGSKVRSEVSCHALPPLVTSYQ
jgi:hypothetical protein